MNASIRLARIMVMVAGFLAVAAPATTSASATVGLDSRSLSGSYLAARYANRQRDLDIAAEYIAHALKLDPNNPVLIERSFIVELSRGNLPLAEEFARRVLKINSQHRMAHIVLGLKLSRAGKHAAARQHFRKASFTPVGELTAGLLLAWSEAAEGKVNEALGALNRLARNSAFANFHAFHAALITDFLSTPSRAEVLYSKAYQRAGTSLRVVQSYGNYLARTGRTEKAREIYRRFLKNSPNNALVREALRRLELNETPKRFIATAIEGMAEAMFSLASALSDERSIDVSLIYDQLALAMRPDFDVARMLLGEIYQDMKLYDRAVVAFRSIPENSVLKPSATIQIAANLNSLKKVDEAVATLDRLLKANPRNYQAWITRGNVMRAHERWREAADSYTKALELAKATPNRIWSVLYFRGISYERLKQWPRAEADFRRALKLRPNQPAILNYLGYSLIEKGLKLDEALAMVKKAVDLRPNDGYIVDSLGWAYFQLGKFDLAVKYLERAVTLKPSDPTINDHLGDAYWRVGRKLEARFQWRHAKDSKPEPDHLKKIEGKLKNGLADLSAETLKAAEAEPGSPSQPAPASPAE